MLTKNIKQSIDLCVLCWLATIDKDGNPNVSPKEAFIHDNNDKLLIANIASLGSVANIHKNNSVCVSFVDIFTQKGYKLKGRANIVEEKDSNYSELNQKLKKAIGDTFPIISIIQIEIKEITSIIAPSYKLFPEKTEADLIQQSLKTYDVERIVKEIHS